MKKAKTLGAKRGKFGHDAGEERSQNTHGTPWVTLGDTAHRPLVLPPGGTPTWRDTHPGGHPASYRHPPTRRGVPPRVSPPPQKTCRRRRSGARLPGRRRRPGVRPRRSPWCCPGRANAAQDPRSLCPPPAARPGFEDAGPAPGAAPRGAGGWQKPPHHACGVAPCLNHGVGAAGSEPGWV